MSKSFVKKRKRECRRVLEGYPWGGKFQTKEEIEDYFSGNTVQCLLCGKRYKELTTHLRRIHNTSADGYKRRYGLPWSQGLGSRATKERRRKVAYEKMKKGLVPYITEDALRPRGNDFAPQKGDQPFARNLKVERALAVHGQERKWELPDYRTILKRMQSQKRTLGDVCKDADVPSINCWNRFVKVHSELHREAQAIHNILPYSVQAKTRIFPMSPQFRKDCRALRKQKLTYAEIGKKLGVSSTAVRYAIAKNSDGSG
jgi:hypothetical protein